MPSKEEMKGNRNLDLFARDVKIKKMDFTYVVNVDSCDEKNGRLWYSLKVTKSPEGAPYKVGDMMKLSYEEMLKVGRFARR